MDEIEEFAEYLVDKYCLSVEMKSNDNFIKYYKDILSKIIRNCDLNVLRYYCIGDMITGYSSIKITNNSLNKLFNNLWYEIYNFQK